MERHFNIANKYGLVLVVFLMLTACTVTGASTDDTARLIYQRIAELETLRTQMQAEHRDRQQQRESLKEQIARLERDLAGVQGDIDDVQDDIAEIQQEHQTLNEQSGQIHLALDTLRESATPIAERTHRRIASGIAFDREERIVRIEAVQALLEGAYPEQIDALIHLTDVALAEVQYAGQRELGNRPIWIDQRKHHGFVYRLGLLTEGFVSEDGRQVGVFDQKQVDWRSGIAGLERDVPAIIATMRQQRPPALLAVPIAAEIRRSVENGEVQ